LLPARLHSSTSRSTLKHSSIYSKRSLHLDVMAMRGLPMFDDAFNATGGMLNPLA
jgi:hypothetical protein